MAEKPLENACWRTIIRIAPSVTVNNRYDPETIASCPTAPIGLQISHAENAVGGRPSRAPRRVSTWQLRSHFVHVALVINAEGRAFIAALQHLSTWCARFAQGLPNAATRTRRGRLARASARMRGPAAYSPLAASGPPCRKRPACCLHASARAPRSPLSAQDQV